MYNTRARTAVLELEVNNDKQRYARSVCIYTNTTAATTAVPGVVIPDGTILY